jgi:hypothetical protein
MKRGHGRKSMSRGSEMVVIRGQRHLHPHRLSETPVPPYHHRLHNRVPGSVVWEHISEVRDNKRGERNMVCTSSEWSPNT